MNLLLALKKVLCVLFFGVSECEDSVYRGLFVKRIVKPVQGKNLSCTKRIDGCERSPSPSKGWINDDDSFLFALFELSIFET